MSKMPTWQTALDAFREDDLERSQELLAGIDEASLDDEGKGHVLALGTLVREEADDERLRPAHVEGILQEHRDRPKLLTAFGITLSDEWRLEAAEAAFRFVCRLHPDMAVPHANIGVVLRRQGRWKEAVSEFDLALALDPTMLRVHLDKAECCLALDDDVGAAAAYRAYLQTEPEDAHCWVSLAIVESDAGRHPEAFDAYERALAVDPDSITAHYNRCLTALRADNPHRARESADELRRIDGNEWRSLIAAAWICELDGDLEQGWELHNRAIEAAAELEEPSVDTWDDETPESSAVAMALGFARKQRMTDHIHAILEGIAVRGLHSPQVLEELRILDDRRSSGARYFTVEIEGLISGQIVREFWEEMEPVPHGYFRRVNVLAESEIEARRIALAFDEEISPPAKRWVSEVDVDPGPCEDYLGVVSRQGMHLFRADEP